MLLDVNQAKAILRDLPPDMSVVSVDLNGTHPAKLVQVGQGVSAYT